MEIKKFNDKWEYTLFQLSETSKKIEDDLQKQHEQEMLLLEEEIEAMGDPPIKFSSELLDRKFKLKQLIKMKKYTEAKIIQEEVRLHEEKELKMIEEKHERAMDKLRENKRKKHSSEYESVKARLEKNINSKLKQRMNEYEKLLLRIQNVHNEMSSKQAREFKKIQSIHAKLLSKYSLNINDVVSRHNQMAEEAEEAESFEEEKEPHDYQPMDNQMQPPDSDANYSGERYGKKSNEFNYSGEGEVLQNERIEELKNGGSESDEHEREVEYAYNQNAPEFTNSTGNSLRNNIKNLKSKKSRDDPQNYDDEEADTVPNLYSKVKKGKNKKEKNPNVEDPTDLMTSKDLPNSFNNYYRVQTSNFNGSEDSDSYN